ncbi:MAG TPA: hypothetical protein VF989_18205, partial [Polyangiaceae bacterium]
MHDEYVIPALQQPTAESLHSFWKQRLVPFRKLLHAYFVAFEADGAPIDDRDSEVEELASAARALGGARGEEILRAAYLDRVLSGAVVSGFGAREPRDPSDDREQAQLHNIFLVLHTAYASCIASASAAQVVPEVKTALLAGLHSYGCGIWAAAENGADLRDMPVAVDEAVVLRVWRRPCEAMFSYLARRVPEMLA